MVGHWHFSIFTGTHFPIPNQRNNQLQLDSALWSSLAIILYLLISADLSSVYILFDIHLVLP